MRGFLRNMEDYRILTRLGKGAQGSVYLVEHRLSKKNYVMKKVECKDENEANKAFREAMTLKELDHPYICKYKAFFVTWDKEDSAMYVCIVMHHYQHGDLSQLLKQQRQKCEKLNEAVIKKWIGQIVEALIFIHKKKVIHRDLKPSNIFLQEDLSICIGDFGVATIMEDCRTKTRTAVGSMNWMAPEVLERPYDERSDIWSAGCIILEFVSCALMDDVSMMAKLFDIKHSPTALDEIFNDLKGVYTNDLFLLIRSMLMRSYDQRPSAQFLSELPYVKICLSISGSVLLGKMKEDSVDYKEGVLPKNMGLKSVIGYLGNNLNNQEAVSESMTYILELVNEMEIDKVDLDYQTKATIVRSMQNFASEMQIQSDAIHIFNESLANATHNDYLYKSEAVSAVTTAMKIHTGSVELLTAGGKFFIGISANENAADCVGKSGGLQCLLTAIRLYPEECELLTTCLNALWSLAISEVNAEIVTEEKGFNDVMVCFKKHLTNEKVAEAAAAAVLSLAIEDENLQYLNGLNCVQVLMDAIQIHENNPKVVKNVCLALAGIIEPDEESAFKVLTNTVNEKDVEGIPILMATYERHKDDCEVVESLCNVFTELAEYDEICAEMKHLNMLPLILYEIKKLYSSDLEIAKSCQAMIEKMEKQHNKINFNLEKDAAQKCAGNV